MRQYRHGAAETTPSVQTRRSVLVGCAGALGLLLAGTALSQAQLMPGVSLQEAVAIATAQRPGRVVRAVTVEAGQGRRIHEVRILLNEGGRVVTVRVDAQTGRIR